MTHESDAKPTWGARPKSFDACILIEMYLFIPLFMAFYAIAYVAVSFLSALFFSGKLPRFGRESVRSIVILAVLIAAVFAVVAFIPDVDLGNRFQHAVGGGVLGVVLCFLVFRDQRIRVKRFQFFVWCVLIVMALGVGNELFEFLAQSFSTMIFADNPLDTWRDLASNMAGIAVAAPAAILLRRV